MLNPSVFSFLFATVNYPCPITSPVTPWSAYTIQLISPYIKTQAVSLYCMFDVFPSSYAPAT